MPQLGRSHPFNENPTRSLCRGFESPAIPRPARRQTGCVPFCKSSMPKASVPLSFLGQNLSYLPCAHRS